uniref:Uncharacterized protein LOC105641803 isoform X2 n=1 Tax=Rhizophora mucronata TaxID=61149 RepID=A0A2P2JI20_RHIMU
MLLPIFPKALRGLVWPALEFLPQPTKKMKILMLLLKQFHLL